MSEKIASDEIIIDCPNSIQYGMPVNRMSKETLMNIHMNRMIDFIDFLFNHSVHCDHITQSEAWEEFEWDNSWIKSQLTT